jgi:predicted metal-dependent hydrolase
MPVKIVEVPHIGTVRLYKRRDSRAIKITINHNNEVRVTLPTWVPYRVGLQFVTSRKDWIAGHRRPPAVVTQGNKIGKAHHLSFVDSPAAQKPSYRISGQSIRVTKPASMAVGSQAVQDAAERGIIRALRDEANQLLPIRLAQLAQKYGFEYKSVEIKLLRSRWGSCSHKQHIALNLYLMQLPWQLIDYVLLHELTHTKVLNHGAAFWQEMLRCDPNAKELRKQLRSFQPQL